MTLADGLKLAIVGALVAEDADADTTRDALLTILRPFVQADSEKEYPAVRLGNVRQLAGLLDMQELNFDSSNLAALENAINDIKDTQDVMIGSNSFFTTKRL